MKISSSIRKLYDQQKELNELLASRVKILFEEGKADNWFYKGRIKGDESFAQKLETGRFETHALEDFFACTLVVENRKAIEEAKLFVEKLCEVVKQKPPADGTTYNQPYEFQFDDLRLYVKLKYSDSSGPSTPINDIIFEVQIKTFLQHAWGIATHGLIYKADNIDWGMQRLAYQIKSMLEHAEISIEMADELAKSSALARSHKSTTDKTDIISWLKNTWPIEQLPRDVRRLAETVSEIMGAFKLDLDRLKQAVALESSAKKGHLSVNLSPYAVIIKALYNHNKPVFDAFLKGAKNSRNKTKLLITPEMELNLDEENDRLKYVY